MTDELRRSLGALTPRERATLTQNVQAAADKWTPLLPRVGQVWRSLAEMADDVTRCERARAAAQASTHQPMRPATKGRT